MSGFGVSWGILILVVMLGTGKGFEESVMNMFSAFAQKSLYVNGGSMSLPFGNNSKGTAILFDNEYFKRLRTRFPEIEALSPEVSAGTLIQNDDKSGVFSTTGINEDYLKIRILKVNDEGRIFNRADIAEERLVAIIGESVATALFGNGKVIGNPVNISGTLFTVTGVLSNDDIFGASDINSVYIPLSSYRQFVGNTDYFSGFSLSVSQATDSKQFEERLRNYIAAQSGFSVKDEQALYIANFETQTSAFEGLFTGLRKIIWIFGLCFLISGVVGVSNIMFVIVKERTREIGIRRTVGATPESIIRLILTEAVIITTLSGLAGLAVGKGILMLIDWILSFAKENMFFKQTDFELGMAVLALIVLIASGMIAGVFPALKASTIQPVEAMRE